MSPDASNWSQLLSPETAARALRVVDEIAADLRKALSEPRPETSSWLRQGPSLAGGDAGQAFFFTYLAQVRPDLGHDDAAMTHGYRTLDLLHRGFDRRHGHDALWNEARPPSPPARCRRRPASTAVSPESPGHWSTCAGGCSRTTGRIPARRSPRLSWSTSG